LGAEAMKMLIEVVEKGEADKRQVILEVELVKRGSA
jgi:DNA-binding LacI/PurR family transcriptional regulator